MLHSYFVKNSDVSSNDMLLKLVSQGVIDLLYMM